MHKHVFLNYNITNMLLFTKQNIPKSYVQIFWSSTYSGFCHVQIEIKISLLLVSDLDTTPNLIVSGCFDRLLRVWTLPDCNLIRTIPAKHAINCVSVCDDLVAACSRTGKVAGSPNVIIWRISTGDLVRTLDVPSCCFVKVRWYLLLTTKVA